MTHLQKNTGRSRNHIHVYKFIDLNEPDLKFCWCGARSDGKKGNKHNAKKTEYDGKVYHSGMEADYAAQLDLMKRAKQIRGWERQVKISFGVCPNCARITYTDKCFHCPHEKPFHLTNYYIDFVVDHFDNTEEFVEVKGQETADWRIKWKLLEAVYGKDEDYKLTIIK